MNRPRWWLVLPALLASAVMSAASAAEIRDKAKLFSPDAVQKAQAELDRLEKSFAVPVTLETIETLDGDTIAEVTNRHAEAVGAQGVYILIPKKEHKIYAEASKHYRQYLPRSRMSAVENVFSTKFKEGNFDGGLTDGVTKIESVFTDAKSDAGGTIRQNTAPSTRRGGAAVPARRGPANKPASGGIGMTLIMIVGGILAVMLVLRIIGAIFRMMSGNQGGGAMMGGRGGYPGQGGPGYGGGGYGGAPAGGGGFMSSMFGGIGGALAGNYLYDQFSGRNHGGSTADQTGYDAGAGAAPVEDNSPEWGGNDTGADWGGGGGTTDAPAGGDWGGGGGDVGGGGDWGGGGGGGDDGGSW